jgi:2-haloacid dehalogenase
VCGDLGVPVTDDALAAFADAVGDWPAFADSADALARLAMRFRLGVITNCDDDLFERSRRRLGVPFDWVITAEQSGAYKPARASFDLALERIDVPRERILHVAQSLFHDHVPAGAMGLATAWVNRRAGREGFGATPPASAVPDLVVPDMRTFAALAMGDPPA